MIFAGQREDLGAFAGFGADGGERLRAAFEDGGNVGQRFDVVDDRRLAEQALHRRERRTRAGHAATSFNAVNQRRLFAAHESSGPHLDQDVQVEAGAEDVVTKQAGRFGLFNRLLQSTDRQRIFGPDVDVGLAGPDAVGGDRHAFHQSVRIAFNDRSVHERAGITFVRVADQVFLVALAGASEFPFLAGGESTSAAAAQATDVDRVADLFGRHLSQRVEQRAVSAVGDVLVHVRRIDPAAVGQDPSRLRREERMLVEHAARRARVSGRDDGIDPGPAIREPCRPNTASSRRGTWSSVTRRNVRRVRPGSCTSTSGSAAQKPMQPTSTISASRS